MCFRPKLLVAIQSCGLQLVHGLLYVSYAVSFAVQFPAFTVANRGLISSFHYVVGGVQSATALEYCDD
jgi:hypothetical protein